MISRLIIWLLFICSPGFSFATGGQYAVTNIPASISTGANAVIRLDEKQVVLKNLEKMTIRSHYVITVFNQKGAELAGLAEVYDRFNSVESIQGFLYDASGDKIKTLRSKDVRDESINSDMNLAMDGRVKVHRFYYTTYPYTVEYIVETVKKETMFFPQWIPVPEENTGVEKSSISVEVPSDYQLRYRAFNYSTEPVIQKKDGKSTVYSWQLSAYPPVRKEYASPAWKKIIPGVMLAPSEFMIEDYRGNMTDWKTLGLFQASLNRDRDLLPEAVKQKVTGLTADAATTREKVERIYRYLQQNTRYVSIQLGVGGWRPYDAGYVYSKGYGDCKALSNYMYSMLKHAGIASHYTLVKAGDEVEDIVASFPARQFNHVILCVPEGRDTIWLECTSQTMAPGYLGKFTSDRHALLITPEGGVLVRTPKYGLEQNRQVRKVKATLEETGTLSVRAQTQYSGLEQDDMHGMINYLSKDRVKEFLHEKLDFATYDITQFDYREEAAVLPAINESLDITVSNYATITGRRVFIIPNVMTRAYRKPPHDPSRQFDIQLRHDYTQVDTVEIELPAGYEPEAIPPDAMVSSQFGKYIASVKLLGNKLVYTRYIEYYGGTFLASRYNEMVSFYETVYKADRNRVVLIRK